MNNPKRNWLKIILLKIIPIITSTIYAFANYNHKGNIFVGHNFLAIGLVVFIAMSCVYILLTDKKSRPLIFRIILVQILFTAIAMITISLVAWLIIHY